MKFALHYSVICCFGFLAMGCQGADAQEAGNLPEDVVANPSTVVNQVSLEECSEFGCPNGCEQIDYGVDEVYTSVRAQNDLSDSGFEDLYYIICCLGKSNVFFVYNIFKYIKFLFNLRF